MNQISLFDIFDRIEEKNNITETVKIQIAEDITKKVIEETISCIESEVINKYLSANRIIKLMGGRYRIEENSKVIYLSSNGEFDYETEESGDIIALDKIIYSNNDYSTNSLQNEILEELRSKGLIDICVKRFADPNYIYRDNNGKWHSINQKGWILDYTSNKISYKSSEILKFDKEIKSNIEEAELVRDTIIESQKNLFNEGDLVEVTYRGENHIGIIVRIYNNGNTANVVFDNKHTAFFIEALRKVS